jgi:hypothetical protein
MTREMESADTSNRYPERNFTTCKFGLKLKESLSWTSKDFIMLGIIILASCQN